MSFQQELIPVLSTLVPIGVIVIGKMLDKTERKAKKLNNNFGEMIEFIRDNKSRIEDLFKKTEKLDTDVRACEKEISRLSGRLDAKDNS